MNEFDEMNVSQTIEQRMPKLEWLSIDFWWCMKVDGSDEWDGLTIVLKSKSLKKAYIPKQMLPHLELDCPSLDELNCY